MICHSEGYRRGIASGHADVEHWFPRHGKSMDDFRADVAAALRPEAEEEDDMTYYEKLNDVPETYKPAIQKLMERGILKGYSDPDPGSLEDNILHLSEDYCRVMTTLDLMGMLG